MKARIGSLILLLGLFAGCTLFLPTIGGPGAAVREPRAAAAGGSLSTIRTNNETIRLDAGTFRGPLIVDGNKVTVIGAGVGITVIAGGVRIDGNNVHLERLSVDGPVWIHGNNNDLRNAELRSSETQVDGNNNRL